MLLLLILRVNPVPYEDFPTSSFCLNGFRRMRFLVSKNLTLLVTKKKLESVLQRILGPFAALSFLTFAQIPMVFLVYHSRPRLDMARWRCINVLIGLAT